MAVVFQNLLNPTQGSAHILPEKPLQACSASMSIETLSKERLPEIFQVFLDRTYVQRTQSANDVMVKLTCGDRVRFLGLPVEEREKALKPYLRSNHIKLIEKLKTENKSYDYVKGLLGKTEAELRVAPDEEVFLPNDPRRFHGCDHAVRTGLFSVVFGYLYNRHLEALLTQSDFVKMIFLGMSHDAGRQRDGGIDIDDERSAELLSSYLKELNVFSSEIIDEVCKSLKKKDGDFHEKTILSRCLHDADSVEFRRFQEVSVRDHWKFDFERLDIVQEIKEKGTSIPELKEVSSEIFNLISVTCGKGPRTSFSKPGFNYFNEILHVVSNGSYPRLYGILKECGIVV